MTLNLLREPLLGQLTLISGKPLGVDTEAHGQSNLELRLRLLERIARYHCGCNILLALIVQL